MFWNKKQNDDDKNERKELREIIKKLKLEIEKLQKHSREIDHENNLKLEKIEHQVVLVKEKNEVELTKAKAKCKTESDNAVAKVKDEYRDKMERQLSGETKRIQEMYNEILKRLPEIKVKM